MADRTAIVVMLDNFRVMHVEQIDALAANMSGTGEVIGLELFASSRDYAFHNTAQHAFRRVVVFPDCEREMVGTIGGGWRLFRAVRRTGARAAVFSHYERGYVFVAALLLRLLGTTMIIVNDSKFDDYARHLWREVGKWILHLPYGGAVVASPRSGDYLRFLGIRPDRIRVGAYTAAGARLRHAAGVAPAPDGTPFDQRDFVCVARLVPKKNHALLLEAFARYVTLVSMPRRLVLCGDGPLRDEIAGRADSLGIAAHVDMRGNVDAAEVARTLGCGLCLLLPSSEEQFGIIVPEAQALGLPVIVGIAAGARDRQVRTAINGFLIEDDNIEGLARLMADLHESPDRWARLARGALVAAEQADTPSYVAAVRSLLGPAPR